MQQCETATLPSNNLSLDVVMTSGAKLATLSVDSSYSVRQLLDDKIAPLVQERAHKTMHTIQKQDLHQWLADKPYRIIPQLERHPQLNICCS